MVEETQVCVHHGDTEVIAGIHYYLVIGRTWWWCHKLNTTLEAQKHTEFIFHNTEAFANQNEINGESYSKIPKMRDIYG